MMLDEIAEFVDRCRDWNATHADLAYRQTKHTAQREELIEAGRRFGLGDRVVRAMIPRDPAEAEEPAAEVVEGHPTHGKSGVIFKPSPMFICGGVGASLDTLSEQEASA